MDSLLANYGPSDDDEEEEPEEKEKPSFDFNLPNRLSSLLASLPPPKPSSSSSSISSLLPPPKSQNSIPSKPSAKKVIQFKPPLNPSLFKSSNLDDDDDDDDVKRKPSKELSPSSQNTTIKNSLPFFLPPPKHSLCLAPPPSSSSGRRGLVETTNPVIQDQEKGKFENHLSKGGDSFDGLSSSTSTRVPDNDNYVENAANGSSYTSSDWVATNEEYATYENYGNYEGDLESGPSTNASSSFPAQENYSDIGSYRNYQSNWGDGAMAMTSSETLVDNVGRVGKRGRNEVPTEMVEVKQDELIGNRPREDQVKLTGIAFGPAYQPVSSSTKAKPTKLQKRKHQIGSLYFDMKQKEMELAERRARGFLTKAETQAKYGW